MSHSDQDTFEESVSDSSTEVIEMFNSSTEENSFVELEVDDDKVEDDEMEDNSEDNDVLIMLEDEEEGGTHHKLTPGFNKRTNHARDSAMVFNTYLSFLAR